jgi:hypothetical protein
MELRVIDLSAFSQMEKRSVFPPREGKGEKKPWFRR